MRSWLRDLPQPVAACYEAGPTGYGLYCAAQAAGLGVEVIAPSKTTRAAGERVKSDRKDAELLARLLMDGTLSAVSVPPRRGGGRSGPDAGPRPGPLQPDARPSPRLESAAASRPCL